MKVKLSAILRRKPPSRPDRAFMRDVERAAEVWLQKKQQHDTDPALRDPNAPEMLARMLVTVMPCALSLVEEQWQVVRSRLARSYKVPPALVFPVHKGVYDGLRNPTRQTRLFGDSVVWFSDEKPKGITTYYALMLIPWFVQKGVDQYLDLDDTKWKELVVVKGGFEGLAREILAGRSDAPSTVRTVARQVKRTVEVLTKLAVYVDGWTHPLLEVMSESHGKLEMRIGSPFLPQYQRHFKGKESLLIPTVRPAPLLSSSPRAKLAEGLAFVDFLAGYRSSSGAAIGFDWERQPQTYMGRGHADFSFLAGHLQRHGYIRQTDKGLWVVGDNLQSIRTFVQYRGKTGRKK